MMEEEYLYFMLDELRRSYEAAARESGEWNPDLEVK